MTAELQKLWAYLGLSALIIGIAVSGAVGVSWHFQILSGALWVVVVLLMIAGAVWARHLLAGLSVLLFFQLSISAAQHVHFMKIELSLMFVVQAALLIGPRSERTH
jgi:hypothetical protein